MKGYQVSDNVFLSAKNRKFLTYGFILGLVLIFISVNIGLISAPGLKISVMDLISPGKYIKWAKDFDDLNPFAYSYGDFDNPVIYAKFRFSFYVMVLPIIVFPFLITAIMTFINIFKTSKLYACATVIVTFISTLYALFIAFGIGSLDGGTNVINLFVPFLQVLGYLVMFISSLLFVLKPITNDFKTLFRKDGNLGKVQNQVTEVGKSIGTSINKVVDGGIKAVSKTGLESENKRLNNEIAAVKRNIGQYIYLNGSSEEVVSGFIDNIRACKLNIGKANESILDIDKKKICPKCGDYASQESKFCPTCGFSYVNQGEKDDDYYMGLSKINVKSSSGNPEITKLKDDISANNFKIKNMEEKIGDYIYTNFANVDETVDGYINRINEIKEKIEINNHEILSLSGLMICPNCGKTVSKNNNFCTECGKSITSDDSSQDGDINSDGNAEGYASADGENKNSGGSADSGRICPKCGASVEADSIFCTECGNKLN